MLHGMTLEAVHHLLTRPLTHPPTHQPWKRCTTFSLARSLTHPLTLEAVHHLPVHSYHQITVLKWCSGGDSVSVSVSGGGSSDSDSDIDSGSE